MGGKYKGKFLGGFGKTSEGAFVIITRRLDCFFVFAIFPG
jgi:hypothetical protein